MALRSLVTLLFVIVFIFASFGKDKSSLEQILPQNVNGWKLSEEIEKYSGDDLFLFINGGAEIYHEYGFREVLSGVYKKPGFKPINAEIYEMEDPSAAFGIYTFKAGSDRRNIGAGNESSLEDYYLNFWKGNYLVTLTGFDEDKRTTDSIVLIAKGIAGNIKNRGTKPPLAKLVNLEDLSELKYLKGNLGLFNIYPFSTDNIFKVKKCVTAIYKKGRIFVFRYVNDEEQDKIFDQVVLYLSGADKYSTLERSENRVLTKDNSGKFVLFYSMGNHLIIFMGDSISAGEKAIKEINKAIKNTSKTKN